MFKQFLTIISLSCLFFPSLAQDTVEDWVYRGIALHDKGEYGQAIDLYKKALKIDRKSPLALYEIAYSHMKKGNYKKAVKYAGKAIKINKKYMLESYLVQGSAYDLRGKPARGIKVLDIASEKYSRSNLIFFNLGIMHNKVGNSAQAKSALISAITIEPNHPGSHLALAQVQLSVPDKNNAALAYLYFLLLEPDSKRSVAAHQNLSAIMDSSKGELPFSEALESLFGLPAKTEEESAEESDLSSNLYIPLFSTIMEKGLTETLVHYIGQHQGVMNTAWLNQHPKQVAQLLETIENVQLILVD